MTVSRRNYAYDLKKRIIEECLYGVDIQEQAVQICELRLWLSLVVDYQVNESLPLRERISGIDALPNLTFRVRVGDSLLDDLFEDAVGSPLNIPFSERAFRYMDLSLLDEARQAEEDLGRPLLETEEHLRRVDRIRDRLKLGFVWQLDFAEVFEDQARRGFDIVFGNPPFVTARNPQMRERYRGRRPTSCYKKYHMLAPFTVFVNPKQRHCDDGKWSHP